MEFCRVACHHRSRDIDRKHLLTLGGERDDGLPGTEVVVEDRHYGECGRAVGLQVEDRVGESKEVLLAGADMQREDTRARVSHLIDMFHRMIENAEIVDKTIADRETILRERE